MFENSKAIIVIKDTKRTIDASIIELENSRCVVSNIYEGVADVGDKIELYIFDSFRGEVVYEGIISKVERKQILITNATYLRSIQRRNEARVELSTTIYINKISPSADKVISLDKFIAMTILNLSASGILLFSKLNLPDNIELFIDLHLSEKEVLTVPSKIVRKQEKGKGFQYGCHFTSISEDDKQKIRQFVFKEQLKLKRSLK